MKNCVDGESQENLRKQMMKGKRGAQSIIGCFWTTP